MEFHEQTELTRKRETDSYVESKVTAMGGSLGVEGLSKKIKGLMDMDRSVVIVEVRQ